MNGKLLYQSPIFKIYKKLFRYNNGKQNESEYITLYEDTLDSVLVAPLTQNNELIFIEEYFRALDKTGLVFPGGVVDSGESPETAAVRELGEEAKLFANIVKPIGIVEVLPKYIYSKTHLFIASNLEPTNQFTHGDEIEDITVRKLLPDRVLSMIKSGQITDARTVALALIVINKSYDQNT